MLLFRDPAADAEANEKLSKVVRKLIVRGATLEGTEDFHGKGGRFEPPLEDRSNVNLLVACARLMKWEFLRTVLQTDGLGLSQDVPWLEALVDALQNDAPVECIRLLLRHVQSVVTVDGRTGRTGLTSAGASSREVVEVMLARAREEGVGIDDLDQDGHSLLMRVVIEATEHCEEVVELLVDKGADPTLRTREGRNVLMLAASVTLPTRLVDEYQFRDFRNPRDQSQKTACVSAARIAHTPRVVSTLYVKGVSLLERDKTGRSAFHHACESGLEDVVCWFVENLKSDEEKELLDTPLEETNETPIMLLAKARNCATALSLLVERGAKIDRVLQDGSSSLTLAARERSNMIGKLLELGADPLQGTHPLLEAAALRPLDFEGLNMLVDNTPVSKELSRRVIDAVEGEGRYYDPYGDFQLAARCSSAVGQERQARSQYEIQEKNKFVQKLRDKVASGGSGAQRSPFRIFG